jgi:phosphocarrier protein
MVKKKIARKIEILNELGLHARSAAKVAELAGRAVARVWVAKEGELAEAKSIMDLLMLECPRGTVVEVIIEDSSDLDVLNDIVQLIENGFGE